MHAMLCTSLAPYSVFHSFLWSIGKGVSTKKDGNGPELQVVAGTLVEF